MSLFNTRVLRKHKLKLMERESSSLRPMNRIKYVARHRKYKQEFESEIVPRIAEKIKSCKNLNKAQNKEPSELTKQDLRPKRGLLFNMMKPFFKQTEPSKSFKIKNYDEFSTSNEKEALLESLDTLRISGIHIENSLKMAVDSDQVSADIIKNLESQRAQLENAKNMVIIL